MKITPELIEKVKRIKIEQFLPDSFKISGNKKFYICPFHHETKPSFCVYTDTNTFFCFAERRGGDVIDFVMQLTEVSFPEAVHFLTNKL